MQSGRRAVVGILRTVVDRTPLAVLVLVIGLAGGRRAWAQVDKLPKGEDVLEKSIEAMGGKAALEKIHSRISKGTMDVPAAKIKGTVTIYEAAPNKNYTIIDIEGEGKSESGSDGTVQWEISARGGPQLLAGEEKALSERQNTFNGALYWRKLYKSVECVGVEEVDGRLCYKLVLTPQAGQPEIDFYDQKTYLPVKNSLSLKGPTGNVTIDLIPSDYKKVDGVLIAHTVTQKVMGMEQILTLKSLEQNVDIPADRFALPAPIKALVEKGKAESKPAGGEKGAPTPGEPKKDKP